MSGILKFLQGQKTYRTVVGVFLLICLVMSVLCFYYYRQLQNTVVTESSGYLQEISNQIGSNASKTIDDNFFVLSTMSHVLQQLNVTTYQQLHTILSEQQQSWNYKNIMLIDRNGKAYDMTGNKVALHNDTYLRDAIISRKNSMSPAQVLNDEECIVFVIPVNNLVIDGVEMYALAASYKLATLDKILSMTAFNGKGYSMMIHRDGSLIVRSSAEHALQTGYNALNSIEDALIIKGNDFKQAKKDIYAGKSGMVDLKIDNEHLYMAYTPLEGSEWCLLTFVPVDVVNAKSQLLMQITLLLCGLITLAFAVLFAVLIISTHRNKQRLENMAFVDPITGGHTIQKFNEITNQLINVTSSNSSAIIYTNIEKFKIFNEQFGRQICDEMLQSISFGIQEDLSEQECLGRISADNFCILISLSDEETLVSRFAKWYANAVRLQTERNIIWPSPILAFGVYVIVDKTLILSRMIDSAKLSLQNTSGQLQGKIRWSMYDDAVRRRLFREKKLEDMMEDALYNREFLVYLQPKYYADSENICGAEALVRWNSSQEGMIYPDEFITLFEKNGFIVQLDLWVFEEVCKHIRQWIDAGHTPFKVSVNCSRVHLKTRSFLNNYHEICHKYQIPPKYLEIELTESVVFEDVQQLILLIQKIREAGFGCSMDDFGSGYSSLNLVQDIPVDTIKLDKVFFRRGSHDMERTESVVNSILTMLKALDKKTVAEGVEEREQVDMLKRLGCDYIQGYYFARPMPIKEFEKLAYGIE